MLRADFDAPMRANTLMGGIDHSPEYHPREIDATSVSFSWRASRVKHLPDALLANAISPAGRHTQTVPSRTAIPNRAWNESQAGRASTLPAATPLRPSPAAARRTL